MRVALSFVVFALAQAAQDPPQGGAPKVDAVSPFTVKTEKLTRALPDGIEMSAEYYAPIGAPPGPLVVCCHMAGSSRGEFIAIAPEFVRYGCSVLAVDLRSGKTRNEITNDTAAAFEKKHGKPATYEEAYADVVEAVKWARELRPEAKIALLGSSYSASLALTYAGRVPDGVDAVLAFSPGEYFEGWKVAAEARAIKVPAYVSCGNGPEEKAKMLPIANAIDKKLKTVFVPAESITARHGAESLAQEDTEVRRRVWSGVYKLINALTIAQKPGASDKGK